MDILIKNMSNNPKDSILEEHLLDGTVIKHEVVEVPPHGRCIDADELQDILRLVLSPVVSNELTEKEISLVHRTIGAISEAINDLDTVLEAST